MSLNRDQINSIAHLARLSLTDAEVPVYQDSLSKIVDLVGQLDAAHTAGIEPMAHPLPGLAQRMRPDVVTEKDQHELLPTQRSASRSCAVSRPQGHRVRNPKKMHTLTLAELAKKLRAKEFSVTELTTRPAGARRGLPAQAQRLHHRDGGVRAGPGEGGRGQTLAAGSAGPLTGLPLAHKDIFCTAGRQNQLRLEDARQLRVAI